MLNLMSKNHIIFTIYFNYDGEKIKKYETNDDYRIIDQKDLIHELINIRKYKFIPDVVILKSALVFNWNKYFN